MAELLVLVATLPNPDGANWTPGDVVSVNPDGHPWRPGASLKVWVAEGNDPADWYYRCAIVKIPGLDPEVVRAALKEIDTEIVDVADETVPGGVRQKERLLKKRRNFLDIGNLPPNIRNKLDGADWEVTVTIDQVKNLLKRKGDQSVMDFGL